MLPMLWQRSGRYRFWICGDSRADSDHASTIYGPYHLSIHKGRSTAFGILVERPEKRIRDPLFPRAIRRWNNMRSAARTWWIDQYIHIDTFDRDEICIGNGQKTMTKKDLSRTRTEMRHLTHLQETSRSSSAADGKAAVG